MVVVLSRCKMQIYFDNSQLDEETFGKDETCFDSKYRVKAANIE